ncbi:MAG: YqiA/YcfP family alpha/beta fold hydrolase [Alloprevotella sp.]
MKKILFAHGFASSGASGTVMTLRQMLYHSAASDTGDEVRVVAPDLPVMPLEAMEMLRQLAADEQPDLILGTSMGAFYAEQLRGFRRILVNPSFQMARLLTFGGMGRREFRNKRADGAHDFKVDKEMIAQFRTLEKESFKGIDAEEKGRVWGLFGDKDKKVNHQKDFIKHYGREHFIVFDGEHFLNDKVLSRSVLPVVRQVLGLS